jgi:uncharacterized protein (TIGR00251 family)
VSWYRLEDGGILLSVRLTPRGGRDAIDGIATLAGGRSVLLARVRVAPEKGAANDALVALIAKAFGRPKSAIVIAAGATARIKQVRINGDATALAHRADRWRESG